MERSAHADVWSRLRGSSRQPTSPIEPRHMSPRPERHQAGRHRPRLLPAHAVVAPRARESNVPQSAQASHADTPTPRVGGNLPTPPAPYASPARPVLEHASRQGGVFPGGPASALRPAAQRKMEKEAGGGSGQDTRHKRGSTTPKPQSAKIMRAHEYAERPSPHLDKRGLWQKNHV